MTFLVVWGWVCAVLGTLAALPQLVRLIRIRSSAGLALPLWQLNFGAGIGWTVHGFTTGHLNMIVPNVLITLTNIAVLVLVQRDRGLRARAVWPLGLLVAALSIAVEFGLPAGWFGAFVLIPHSIGALAQTRDLVRERDLSGVSAPFLVIAAVLQGCWLLWAVLTPDWSVIWAAGVLIVIGTVNVAIYVARRHAGRVAVVPDAVGAETILAARTTLDVGAATSATGVQGTDPVVPLEADAVLSADSAPASFDTSRRPAPVAAS